MYTGGPQARESAVRQTVSPAVSPVEPVLRILVVRCAELVQTLSRILPICTHSQDSLQWLHCYQVARVRPSGTTSVCRSDCDVLRKDTKRVSTVQGVP